LALVTRHRRLARACALVALVVVVRHLAGVWVAAAIVALAGVVGLIACLAALDAWAGDRHRCSAPATVVPDRSAGDAADRLAFARALAAVASAYVAECERGAGFR
jgi:hypothetical protein